MAYAVQTPVFEGPFDVLLHLITKQQVELYDVPLAVIVDGFLEHLESMQRTAKETGVRLDLEMTTQFLLIAATLVELKTRRLLPGREDLELDEELALWEERDLLLARLVECKTFKDAALALVALEDGAKQSFPRRAGMEERFLSVAPDPLEGTSADRLRKAFLKVVAPKPEPPRVTLHHVTQIRMTVADAMEELVEALPRIGRTTFRNLTAKYTERMEVIVHFLGLLELYKEGVLDLHQWRTFGELEVVWLGNHFENESVNLEDRQLVDAYEG